MKKLCCILALIVLLLNSSFMIVISEAVNTITNNFLTEQKETLEEKKEDIEVINEANIYNGYMIANLTNPENKYETKYTDILGLEINNKATIQEIMIKETNKFVNEEKIEEANTSETQTKKEEIENNNILMYESTKVNKKSIFDVLKSNGTIEIIDENEEILKTINKDTETDEDGNINITYENKLKELTIKIKNIEKEGNINFVNTKVIDASFNNLDCKVKTETTIEGKNIRNKVTYENTKENILDIKDAYSEIDANLDVENLVNNVSNNTVLTLTLKTNEAKYSLFRNPTISIEMPEEIEDVQLEQPSLMYNNKIFEITNAYITTNEKGNKVLNIVLLGNQNTYEEISFINGTDIIIPLTITLKKEIETKTSSLKLTYTNEVTDKTAYNIQEKEYEEIDISILNKIGTVIPKTTSNVDENTIVYEDDEVKVEVIELLGKNVISNGGILYEEQIVRNKIKITNKSNISKNITITANLPKEILYAKLHVVGVVHNEEYDYYLRGKKYEYVKDRQVKETSIDSGALTPGATYEGYFDTYINDLNDDLDNVETAIRYDIKINKTKIQSFEVKNIIKQAEIGIEFGLTLGNNRENWFYDITVKNLTNRELKNVNVLLETSPFFEITTVTHELKNNVGSIEENLWTYTIESLLPYTEEYEINNLEEDECGNQKVFIIEGNVVTKKFEDYKEIKNIQGSEYELKGNCVVYGNTIMNKYVANEVYRTGNIEEIEVTMSSDKEGQMLKWNDEITYTVTIKNTGEARGFVTRYTHVNLFDLIPRELQPISATYNNYILEQIEVPDVDYPDIMRMVQKFSEETVNLDLSNLIIQDGYDEETAPNINEYINIPFGKTVTIIIKAKAKMLLEKTDIINKFQVTGTYITTKSASLSNTILNYDYDKPTDPENPDKPPVDPDNPDKPPVDPDDPDNPNNPDNQEKISISGTAWIDANEDGKKGINEESYSNMTVMLYDYNEGEFITENGSNLIRQTDSNGRYFFENIDKGSYIVVFLYDTNNYILTEYQKAGVNEKQNSNAISKTIMINGQNVEAGLTDALIVDENITDINIGLIEKKDFDLEIQKYISKITIQTAKETKTYTYDNKQFAKVEVHAKSINGAKVIIEYKMVIINKGELPGKVSQIIDEKPEDLTFYSELNKEWYENKGVLYTASIAGQTINVGESKEITLILTKDLDGNSLGTIVNTVKINLSSNDKAIEDRNSDNDISKAEVIISISTGLIKWVGIAISAIIILIVIAILIIKNRKILKIMSFVVIFSVFIFGNMPYSFGVKIKGVNTNLDNPPHDDAIGDDGYQYTCQDPVPHFCDNTYDHVSVSSTIYNESKEYGSWSDVPNLSLSNNTNNSNINFRKYDNNYNLIGPFKVSVSDTSASRNVTVYYKYNNGTTGSTYATAVNSSGGNFSWGQDLYLKIPNNIIEVTKLSISSARTYTRSRSVKTKGNLVYTLRPENKYSHEYTPETIKYGHEAEGYRCFCTKHGIQRMGRWYEETNSEYENVNKTASIDITGPWTAQGNLEIVKVDADDGTTPLANVEFKITKGTSSSQNYYLQLRRNGSVVAKVSAGIGITLQNYVSYGSVAGSGLYVNNPTTAVIGGVSYQVYFTSTYANATSILTNTSGRILINNLRCGQYVVVETTSNNYGYTKLVTVSAPNMISCNTTQWKITNQKQTGNLYLKKIDSRNTSKVLPNVGFVLKSSLNNQYIKVTATGGTITNGSDGYATKIIGKTIVTNITYTTNINLATKFTTDSRGEICIYNLLMNSGSAAIRYHLEEVENPNYGYIINTTTHNNYRVVFDGNAPSGWVTLPRVVSQQTKNINSTQRLSTIVKNVQSYIALSGTVWEDIYSGKNNQGDNKYTEGIDALVKGIKVYLYKNGRVVATRITDENGYYKFGGKQDYTADNNGNLLIDDLSQYHIEFEYDGLKFTTVKSDWNYTVPNGAGSKTAEVPSGRSDRKDRNSVNEDFTEITNNTARNSSGTKTYNLEYNFANHRSTFIEHWKYKYSQNKNKKKILQVTYNYDNQNDYEIIGSTKQSGFNLKQLWDKSYQNTGNESIDNINHGIIKREQPDMALSSDIDYVNVIVNGYENTYQYGGRKTYTTQNENSSNYNAELDGFDVGVKFGNKYSTSFSNRGLTTYTRPIYESDLSLYNKGYETNKDLMQIYVTYKIVLTNQSTKLYGKISELKNYHDSRYTIVDSWINNNTNNKVTWVDNGKYGNTYKDEDYMAVYTQSIKNIEIAPNGSVAIYIKFKINSDTVKGLMHKQPTLDNITEITSYSTGTKTNGNWQKYAGVDEDSNPETAKIQWTTKTVQKDENGYQKEVRELNKTTYEDDTDVAPSLILDFSKENPTRGLSGTVFEDKTKENTEAGKTRLGDGKYTVGENTIYNAKVELLEANDDGTIIYETDEEGKSTPKVATLYSLEISKDGGIRKVTTKEIPAITYTNKDGNYVFNGIVPDRYLIRYTYDNNCYIMKPNTTYSYVKDEEKGILQSDMKFENGMRISYKTTDTSGRIVDKELLPINIVNYKSTIIGSPKIKQALQQISGSHQMTRMGNLNWIVEYEKNGENIIRYSDAVDDTVIRDKLDSDGYYGNHEEIEMYMNADTAVFDIGVEYSKVTDYKSWTDYRDEFEFKNEIIVVKNGRLVRQPTFYAINPYQDFGIVERARQDIKIQKEISKLKLVLSTGQVVLYGNPYTDNLPYVKALPGMVYAEIDNELIQGATLELEYTITIINDSELDYEYRYNKNTNKNKKTTAEYYYYGTNNEQAKEISAQIRKVVDYMESDLVYDTEKNKDVWKVVVADDLKNYSEDGVEKRLIADNVAEDLKEGYTISITEYFYNKNIPIGGKLSTNIYASKLLSTKADGISAKNHAEIIQIYGGRNILNSTPGNYDPVTEQKNEQDNSMTSLVINPPTGLKDNIIIYIVAGGIGLVILAVGVYIIRKKVIN